MVYDDMIVSTSDLHEEIAHISERSERSHNIRFSKVLDSKRLYEMVNYPVVVFHMFLCGQYYVFFRLFLDTHQ